MPIFSKDLFYIISEDDDFTAKLQNALTFRKFHYSQLSPDMDVLAQISAEMPRLAAVFLDMDLHGSRDFQALSTSIIQSFNVPLVYIFGEASLQYMGAVREIHSYGYLFKDSPVEIIQGVIWKAFTLYEQRNLSHEVFFRAINGLCVHKMLYNERGEAIDCLYLNVNPSFETHTGLSPAAVIGKTIRDFYPNEEADDVIQLYSTVLAEHKTIEKEFYFEPTRRWYHLSVFPLNGDDFTVVIQNITEEKDALDQLKARERQYRKLAEENELLLKETHHRIKNNMNTIFSFLQLQGLTCEVLEARQALLDAAGRVQSMMILYEKLYRSKTIYETGSKNFFTDIIAQLKILFKDILAVRFELDLEDFNIHAKTLLPLGIILNELISNSVKHAFIGISDPCISVSIHKFEQGFQMVYSDNGVGFGENIQETNANSLGMQLLSALVEQIGGTYHRENATGARFSLTAPLTKA